MEPDGEGTMQKQIGDAAGIIWKYLDQHTESTLSELKQATKLSEKLALMGLGVILRPEPLPASRGPPRPRPGRSPRSIRQRRQRTRPRSSSQNDRLRAGSARRPWR